MPRVHPVSAPRTSGIHRKRLCFLVASAIVGKADILVTTDDRFSKRLRQFGRVRVLFPMEAVSCLEKWYED